MKKLIFLLFILTGCGYNAMDNTGYIIITDIESNDNGLNGEYRKEGCFYYVKGSTAWRRVGSTGAYFFDECGKFTVGDTIYITKKIK